MNTKTALLASAERMMRQRGYAAVSFGDLAEDVGIRKASIHYHFPKKADLAAELIGTYATRLARYRANIAANAPSGGAAIASLIVLYRAATDEGRQLCLCVAFATGRDLLDSQVLAVLNKFHADSLNWLEDAFERANDDGSVEAVSHPRDEAAACLALLEGAQLMARAAGNPAPYDTATRVLAQRIR